MAFTKRDEEVKVIRHYRRRPHVPKSFGHHLFYMIEDRACDWWLGKPNRTFIGAYSQKVVGAGG